MELSIALALLAGLASFVSPCFLPVVPVFIAQLVGTEDAEVSRKNAVLNTIIFILGFTVVFITLWASIGLAGVALGKYVWIARIVGGSILILMGLFVAGLIQLPLLNQTYRANQINPANKPTGMGKSLLMGVIFAAGWTPCIGPILGGILGLASQANTVWQGIMLMLVFCAGLGIPLLLVSVGAADVHRHFLWFKQHHQLVALISGGMLVVIGFLMVTNLLGKISNLIPAIV